VKKKKKFVYIPRVNVQHSFVTRARVRDATSQRATGQCPSWAGVRLQSQTQTVTNPRPFG